MAATASNRGNRGNSNWQHNPQHRGGAPYGDRNTANKYGGTARGDSMQNRQANARQNQARQQPSAGNRGRVRTVGTVPALERRDAGNRGGSERWQHERQAAAPVPTASAISKSATHQLHQQKRFAAAAA